MGLSRSIPAKYYRKLVMEIAEMRAVLVNDGDKDYWLPKSLTENNGDGTFTIPEWLAIEKGIV